MAPMPVNTAQSVCRFCFVMKWAELLISAPAMIYLHRSFFAQAMLDFPTNPLRSPFATSFLTAYRSASVIIKGTAYQFDRNAEMAMRVWFLLHQTFSAAVGPSSFCSAPC